MYAQRTAAALLTVLALVAGCDGSRTPRSIVLVTIDTLRADRLGCYGHPAGLTPYLDRLAAESVLFEDVSAPTPVTLPSHASLLTGRYPTETGVRNNGTFTLPPDETTLAELLSHEGFSTAAVVAAYPLQRRFGLDQGFDRYDDALPGVEWASGDGLPVHFPERSARAVTDRALRVWRGLGRGRRFLWVHYFDPHAPYAAPEPYAERGAHPYDGEVAYVDAELQRLLDVVLADDPGAVVAVTADHGEGLGDHGEKTHGVFLYQSTIRVPLLLRAPGRLPGGARVDEPVSLVDLMPTLLRLASVRVPGGVQGADLAPLTGGGPSPRRPVYAESWVARLEYRFHDLAALRDGTRKYIRAPRPELYDLRADPGEADNLFGRHATALPAEGDRLAARLETFLAAADPDAGGRAAGGLDEEARERLRSLGYLAAGPALAPETDNARDPKDMTDYFRRHDRALGAISAARYDDGIAGLQALLPEAPENYILRYQLSAALAASKRYSEAIAELRHVLAADPGFGGARLLLAEVLFRSGAIDDAIATLEEAAERSPADPEPALALGELLASLGRFPAAADAYADAVRRGPRNERLLRRFVTFHETRGTLDRAARELEAAAGGRHDPVELWIALGRTERKRGRLRQAVQHLRRAVETASDRHEAWIELGEIHLRAGNARAAETAFRRALDLRPATIPILFGLARSLLAQDRLREADEHLDRLLALQPDFSPAHSARGHYQEQRGNHDAAAAAYREALKLNPKDRNAREGLQRLNQR